MIMTCNGKYLKTHIDFLLPVAIHSNNYIVFWLGTFYIIGLVLIGFSVAILVADRVIAVIAPLATKYNATRTMIAIAAIITSVTLMVTCITELPIPLESGQFSYYNVTFRNHGNYMFRLRAVLGVINLILISNFMYIIRYKLRKSRRRNRFIERVAICSAFTQILCTVFPIVVRKTLQNDEACQSFARSYYILSYAVDAISTTYVLRYVVLKLTKGTTTVLYFGNGKGPCITLKNKIGIERRMSK
ncbi:unnamed protein product [Bursaphelenchus xylophilus]|uniref:(pine wood nematode) hypothetical protein n=1 Tax=Bursaphelenchus xylophilus TaxID=6326 RepID=A0A811LZ76_BURXY|nr:unnamed protein product [Bursaphelenchus xylophilus]CAG9128720.1 unnamed protein product [Bursaphelenchus xylophilus]